MTKTFKALSFILCSFFLLTLTPINVSAKDNSFKAINVEKSDSNINISIDTKEIGNDVEVITDKAKEGYSKLEESGILTKLFDLSKEILSLFSNFLKDLVNIV